MNGSQPSEVERSNSRAPEASEQRRRLFFFGAALALLALLAAVSMLPSPSGREGSGLPEPSRLFDEAQAGCGAGGAAARRRAELLIESALAKMDRYPFDPADGVEAVRLQAKAAACFAGANESELAKKARSQLERWKHQLGAEYHAHRLRLRRALETRDQARARSEAAALRRLLGHRADAYTAWLERLDRRLALEASGEKKE